MISRRPERVIDTHVHIWSYNSPWMEWINARPKSWDVIRRDISWQELRGELDAAGVAEVILMQACPTPAETRFLLDVAGQQPSVVGVVGWVSLLSQEATERDLASFDGHGSGKLVGIRVMHGWEPEGEILIREQTTDSLRIVAQHDLSIDIFVGDHSELGLAAAITKRIPEGRYVIDHLGRPPIGDTHAFKPWADAMLELSKQPNIFVKYSGWATFAGKAHASDVRPFIDHVLNTFGPERTIFASNWPVALVADSYAATYAATIEAIDGLSADELDQIMYRTTQRFYLRQT